MSDAETLPKPFKGKTERFEVDGCVVELVKMPPDQRRAYHGAPEPAVRSQWEIRVDGVLMGYAVYPLGVGKPWEAYSLMPNTLRNYGEQWQFEWASQAKSEAPRVWKCKPTSTELEGAWHGWTGRFYHISYVGSDGTNGRSHRNGWTSREAIARAWPKMIASGKAPTAEVVERAIHAARTYATELKAKEAREKIETEARWAKEAAQRERDKQAAEEQRLEIISGLESIRDRLGRELTNLESVALGRAIEKFGGKAR